MSLCIKSAPSTHLTIWDKLFFSVRTSVQDISPRPSQTRRPHRPLIWLTTQTPTKSEPPHVYRESQLTYATSLTFCIFNFRTKSNGGSDSGDSDNNNNAGDEAEEDDEYDDEYVPEWHEDYDEEDIDDDDFFSDDDESENLERDFSPFD